MFAKSQFVFCFARFGYCYCNCTHTHTYAYIRIQPATQRAIPLHIFRRAFYLAAILNDCEGGEGDQQVRQWQCEQKGAHYNW